MKIQHIRTYGMQIREALISFSVYILKDETVINKVTKSGSLKKMLI